MIDTPVTISQPINIFFRVSFCGHMLEQGGYGGGGGASVGTIMDNITGEKVNDKYDTRRRERQF